MPGTARRAAGDNAGVSSSGSRDSSPSRPIDRIAESRARSTPTSVAVVESRSTRSRSQRSGGAPAEPWAKSTSATDPSSSTMTLSGTSWPCVIRAACNRSAAFQTSSSVRSVIASGAIVESCCPNGSWRARTAMSWEPPRTAITTSLTCTPDAPPSGASRRGVPAGPNVTPTPLVRHRGTRRSSRSFGTAGRSDASRPITTTDAGLPSGARPTNRVSPTDCTSASARSSMSRPNSTSAVCTEDSDGVARGVPQARLAAAEITHPRPTATKIDGNGPIAAKTAPTRASSWMPVTNRRAGRTRYGAAVSSTAVAMDSQTTAVAESEPGIWAGRVRERRRRRSCPPSPTRRER